MAIINVDSLKIKTDLGGYQVINVLKIAAVEFLEDR